MAWFDLDEETKTATEDSEDVFVPADVFARGLAAPEKDVVVSEEDFFGKGQIEGQVLNPLPERTYGKEFSVGLDRGEDQLRGLGYGLVGLAADALGVKAGADWGFENYQQAMEEAASKQATVADPFEDIENFSDAGRYAVGLLGEQIPQLLTSIIGGGVGGAVGKSLAKKMVANEVLKRVAKGATATAAEREVAEAVTRNVLSKAATAKAAEEGAELGLAGAAAATRAAAQKGVAEGTRYGAYTGAYLANFGQIAGGTYGQVRDETRVTGPDAVMAATATAVPGAALDTLSELFVGSKFFKSLKPFDVERKALNLALPGRLAVGAAQGAAVAAPLEGGTEYLQTGLEQAAVGMADPNQTVEQRLAAPGAERERRVAGMAGLTIGGMLGTAGGAFDLMPRTRKVLEDRGAAPPEETDDRFETSPDGNVLEGDWSDSVNVDGLDLRFNPTLNVWAAINPPEIKGLGPAVAAGLGNTQVALISQGTRSGAALAAKARYTMNRMADGELPPLPEDETEAAPPEEESELVPFQTRDAFGKEFAGAGQSGVGGAKTPTFSDVAKPGATIEYGGARGVIQDYDERGNLKVDFGTDRVDSFGTERVDSIAPDRFNDVRVISEQQLERERATEAEIEKLQQELTDQTLAEEERAAKEQTIADLRQRLLPEAVQRGVEPVAVFTRRRAEIQAKRRAEDEALKNELRKNTESSIVGGLQTGSNVSVLLGDDLVPAKFVATTKSGAAFQLDDEEKTRIELPASDFNKVTLRVEPFNAALTDEAEYNERLRNAKTPEDIAAITGGYIPNGQTHVLKTEDGLRYRVQYFSRAPKKGKPALTGETALSPEIIPSRFAVTPTEEKEDRAVAEQRNALSKELAAIRKSLALRGSESGRSVVNPTTDAYARAKARETELIEMLAALPAPYRESAQAAVGAELARGLAEGVAAVEGKSVGVVGKERGARDAAGGIIPEEDAEPNARVGNLPFSLTGQPSEDYNEIWGRGPTGQLVMKRPVYAKLDLILEAPTPKPDYNRAYQQKLAAEREKNPVFGLSGPELAAFEAEEKKRANKAAQGQFRQDENNHTESYNRLKRQIAESMDSGHVVAVSENNVESKKGRMDANEFINFLYADPDIQIEPRIPLDPSTGKPRGAAQPTIVSLVWRGADGTQQPRVITQGSERVKGGAAQRPQDLKIVDASRPKNEREREALRETDKRYQADRRGLDRTHALRRQALGAKIREARFRVQEADRKIAGVQKRREEREALEAEVLRMEGAAVEKPSIPKTPTDELAARREEIRKENEKAAANELKLRKQIRELNEKITKAGVASQSDKNKLSYRSRASGDASRMKAEKDDLENRLRETQNAKRRRATELTRIASQIEAAAASDKEQKSRLLAAARQEKTQLRRAIAERKKALSNFVVDETPIKKAQEARAELENFEQQVEPLELELSNENIALEREYKDKAYNPSLFDELQGLGSFKKLLGTDPKLRLDAEETRARARITGNAGLSEIVYDVAGQPVLVTPRDGTAQEILETLPEAERVLLTNILKSISELFGGGSVAASKNIVDRMTRGLNMPLGETEAEEILATAQSRLYNSAAFAFQEVVNERVRRGGAPSQVSDENRTEIATALMRELSKYIADQKTKPKSESEPQIAIVLQAGELGVDTQDVQDVLNTRSLEAAQDKIATLKARPAKFTAKRMDPFWKKLYAAVEEPKRIKSQLQKARRTGSIKKQDLTAAKERALEKLPKGESTERALDSMISLISGFNDVFNLLGKGGEATKAIDAARKRVENMRAAQIETTALENNPEVTRLEGAPEIDQQALIDEAKLNPESKLLGAGAGTTPTNVLNRESFGYLRDLENSPDRNLLWFVAGLARRSSDNRVWYSDGTGAQLNRFNEAAYADAKDEGKWTENLLVEVDKIDDDGNETTDFVPVTEVLSAKDIARVQFHIDRLRDIPRLPERPAEEDKGVIELKLSGREGVIDPGTTGGIRSTPVGRYGQRALAEPAAASDKMRFGLAPSPVAGTGLDPSTLTEAQLMEGVADYSLGGKLAVEGAPEQIDTPATPTETAAAPAAAPVFKAPRPSQVREMSEVAVRYYVRDFLKIDVDGLSEDEIGRIYQALQTQGIGAETTLAAGGNVIGQTPQPMADILSTKSARELLEGMVSEEQAARLNKERAANLRKNIGALVKARAFADTETFLRSASEDASLPKTTRIVAKELLRLNDRVGWNDNVAVQMAAFGRNFVSNPVTQAEIDKRIRKNKAGTAYVVDKKEYPIPASKVEDLELRQELSQIIRSNLMLNNAVTWAGRAVSNEGAFGVYLNLNAVHDNRKAGAIDTLLHELQHVVTKSKLSGLVELNEVERKAVARLEQFRRQAVVAAAKSRGITIPEKLTDADIEAFSNQLLETANRESDQTLRALTKLDEFVIEVTGNPEVAKLLAQLGFGKGSFEKPQSFTGALREIWNAVVELISGVRADANSPLAQAFTDSWMITYASVGEADRPGIIGGNQFTAPKVVQNSLVNEFAAALEQERFIRSQIEARDLAGTSSDRNALANEWATIKGERAKQAAAREAELAKGRVPTKPPKANLPDFGVAPAPKAEEPKAEEPKPASVGQVLNLGSTLGQRPTMTNVEEANEQAAEAERADNLARMALSTTEGEFVDAVNAAVKENPELQFPETFKNPRTLYYVTRAAAADRLNKTGKLAGLQLRATPAELERRSAAAQMLPAAKAKEELDQIKKAKELVAQLETSDENTAAEILKSTPDDVKARSLATLAELEARSRSVEQELRNMIVAKPDEADQLGPILRTLEVVGARKAKGRKTGYWTTKELEELLAGAEARKDEESAKSWRGQLAEQKAVDAALAKAEKAAQKQFERDRKKAERSQAKVAEKALADAKTARGLKTATQFGIAPKPKPEPKPEETEEKPAAKKAAKEPTPQETSVDLEAAISGLSWNPWRKTERGPDGPKWVRDAPLPKDDEGAQEFWNRFNKKGPEVLPRPASGPKRFAWANKKKFRDLGLVVQRQNPTSSSYIAVQYSAPQGFPDPEPEVSPDQRTVLPTEDDIDLLEAPDPTADLSLGSAIKRIFRDEILTTPTGGTFVRPKLISAVNPLMDRKGTALDNRRQGAINAEVNRADNLLRILAKQMRQSEEVIDPQVVTTAIGSLDNPLTKAQQEDIRRTALTDPEAAVKLNDKYKRENREAFREKQRRARLSLPKDIRATATEMSGHVESLQRQLQAIGILGSDLMVQVSDSLGMYLNRSYAIFDNPKWVERVRKNAKVMGDARRAIKRFLVQAKADALRDGAAEDGILLSREDALRTANKSVATSQVEEELERYLALGNSPGAKLLSGRITGAKDLSILKRRGVLDPEIQALLGVYDNPETSYGKTVLKLSSLVYNHVFLTELKTLGLSEGWFYESPKIVSEDDTEYRVVSNGETMFASPELEAAKAFLGTLDKEPPPGYTKIAAEGSDKLAPLDGVYGMPDIVEGLYEMFRDRDADNWFLRLAGGATGYSMAFATVGSAQSQVRNYLSGWLKYLSTGNLIGGSMDAIRKAHKYAFEEMANRTGGDREKIRAEIEDLVRRKVFGESVTVNMINDLVDDYRSLGIAAQKGQTDFEKTFDKFLRRPVKQVWDFAQGTYSMGDNIFRGMVYYSEIENYRQAYPKWSEEQLKDTAAQISRDIYWTYSEAPKWVQDLKRGPGLVIAPFITFTTEVVRTLINTGRLAYSEWKTGKETGNNALVKLAWRRASGMALAASSLNIAGAGLMAMAGFSSDDEEDLRKFLPEWQRNNQLLLYGREGNKIKFADVLFLDPNDYFHRTWKGFMRAVSGAENPQEAIVNGSVTAVKGLLSPFTSEQLFAGAVMDVARNMDSAGRRVYNPQDTADNIVEAIGSHIGNVFVPGTARSLYRIGMGATGTVTESGRSYDPVQELVAMTTGQRLNEIDLSQSLGFKAAEYNKNRRDATALFNRVALNSGEVNPGDVADGYDRKLAADLRLATSLRETYRAARRLGLSDAAATERLRALGISREDVEMAKTGVFEPDAPSKEMRQELLRRGLTERIQEMDRAYQSALTEQILDR